MLLGLNKINITITVKWSFLFGIALLQNSCFFDSESNRIIGDYKILWIDLPANQTISKEYENNPSSSSVIIPEYVFAVGHNEDFIIAKQHPTNGFKGGYEVDITTTNYYIIDINRKIIKNKKGLLGALIEDEFNAKLKELKITNLNFDRIYPDNPN